MNLATDASYHSASTSGRWAKDAKVWRFVRPASSQLYDFSGARFGSKRRRVRVEAEHVLIPFFGSIPPEGAG
jgi:hypothetical protein